jgi:urea transport system ATP-binding protein
LSVSFDGFKAINDLNLYIKEGELRCIIGPNGAGNTTLMDIITGKTRPDTGTVFFGQDIDLLQFTEPEIAQIGIGRKFQKPTVFEQHSVFENLELAIAANKRVWPTLTARLNAEQIDNIDRILLQAGLIEMKEKPASLLSHGQKQWLEIAMLVMQEPRLLLVDEPVAGMTHQEMDKTAELLHELAGDHSVVVVEHDMDFVRSIASDVTVLHQGSVLAEGTMEQVQNNPQVVEVYLGE